MARRSAPSPPGPPLAPSPAPPSCPARLRLFRSAAPSLPAAILGAGEAAAAPSWVRAAPEGGTLAALPPAGNAEGGPPGPAVLPPESLESPPELQHRGQPPGHGSPPSPRGVPRPPGRAGGGGAGDEHGGQGAQLAAVLGAGAARGGRGGPRRVPARGLRLHRGQSPAQPGAGRAPARGHRAALPPAGQAVSLCVPRECDVWLSLGGFHERGQDWDSTGRIYNCHLLLDSSGALVAAYRKLHLFDAALPGAPALCESSFTNPGRELLPPIDTPVGKVGLAVCYDLRFPELAQALRGAGAQILTYPSAFTVPTGAAHWEVLLRARAIECQCYVVAAAQTGRHNAGRASFGHSLVADPWGTVVAQCHEGPGLCLAHIDLAYLEQVRRELPVHGHRRGDIYGALPGTPGT